MPIRSTKIDLELSEQIAKVSQNISLDIYRLNSILKNLKRYSKEVERRGGQGLWEVETLHQMAVEINKLGTAIHSTTNNIQLTVEAERNKLLTSNTGQ